MSAGALAAVLGTIGMAAFFAVLALVVRSIRSDQRWRQMVEHEKARARARRRKPGPTKREREREAIRLQGMQLARDVAAGRTAPLGPRVTLEQIRAERQ